MERTGLASFTTTDIEGRPVALSDLDGRVVLVVNTASACGFTPQFDGLEALWRTYRDRGLTVIGFPSNEFGGQDPGNNDAIATFCRQRHGVTFPMMARTEVNGAQAEPLFRWLKAQAPGVLGTEAVKWNFTKFLVGRDGRVISRHAPQTPPAALVRDIEQALAEPAPPSA